MGEMPQIRFIAVEERKTTNTIRFEEVPRPGEERVVGYFYVQKKALAKIGNPRILQVTVSPGNKEQW